MRASKKQGSLHYYPIAIIITIITALLLTLLPWALPPETKLSTNELELNSHSRFVNPAPNTHATPYQLLLPRDLESQGDSGAELFKSNDRLYIQMLVHRKTIQVLTNVSAFPTEPTYLVSLLPLHPEVPQMGQGVCSQVLVA